MSRLSRELTEEEVAKLRAVWEDPKLEGVDLDVVEGIFEKELENIGVYFDETVAMDRYLHSRIPSGWGHNPLYDAVRDAIYPTN